MSLRSTTTIATGAAVLALAALVAVGSVFFARPATAQTNGVSGMRQVTVVGEGKATGKPDTATVQIGVETQAATAQEAMSQNNTQAQTIQAKLTELGIEAKDMQTANFNISPVYNDNGQQVTGYRVSNSVSVTIRNLDSAGQLLDQVVQAGANSVYGISFSVGDPAAQLEQARTAAMQDAKTRAEQLAKAGNASVGSVLVITENVGSTPPVMMPMAARAEDTASAVPVQAGEQSFSVSVQVTYELR